MSENKIRIISIGVALHKDKILVSKGYDSVKKSFYYRPPGGGIDFGETSLNALKREIKEEIGCAVDKIQFLGALENIFTCDGGHGHEIVFVYSIGLMNKAFYKADIFSGIESDGSPIELCWKSIDSFDAVNHRLVPEELINLIRKNKS